MTRPVRPITAKAKAGINIYATVRDGAGLYFDPAAGLFGAAYAGVALAETDVQTAVLGLIRPGVYDNVGGQVYSAPFPPAVTKAGLYSVAAWQRSGATPAPTDPPLRMGHPLYGKPVAYGRTIHPPDFLPLHGHYGIRQPPHGSTPDLSLGLTRSLRHAWLLNGGAFAHDALRPKRHFRGAEVGYTVATRGGRGCAFTDVPDGHVIGQDSNGNEIAADGYLLGYVKFVGRTFTLLGSVDVPNGAEGVVFSVGAVALSKIASGYSLAAQWATCYRAPDDTVLRPFTQDLPPVSPGFHRWAVTYTAPVIIRHAGPLTVTKAGVLSVYCDGDLLFRCDPGELGGSYLILGRSPTELPNLPPGSCHCYHENYQYHGRALTDAEVAQDALTPYACYARPGRFPRLSL